VEPEFLQPDERPILILRRNPRSALDAWLGIAFLWALVALAAFVSAGFVTVQAVPYSIAAVLVATLIAVGASIAVGLRVATTRMVVTADRVYHGYGKFRFFLSQTTYDRVTDLHVHQSFFGRRFGFGTVLVQTAGLGVRLPGVNDPMGVKQAIEQARESLIRRLVAGYKAERRNQATGEGRKTKAPDVATTSGGGTLHWTGGPTAASMVVRYLGPATFYLVFLSFSGAAALLTNPRWAWVVPIGVLVGLGLLAWNALMQFRRTSYEIHGWGVVVSKGWLSRRRVEARYEKVTDVSVLQPVLGRLFGYGTLQINTAGSNDAAIQFHGVRRPDEVKALVDVARGARSRDP
jgi:uncharacterized membrane protein YdbT with pleckstrin-like domain